MVSEATNNLHNQVDDLECHLIAAEILENNGIPQTIAFVKDIQVNEIKHGIVFLLDTSSNMKVRKTIFCPISDSGSDHCRMMRRKSRKSSSS